MDLVARIRSSFVAGLLLLAPLAVTVFVLQFAFRQVTSLVRPLVVEIQPFLARVLATDDVTLAAQLLAALIVALAITVVGYITSISVGARLFGGFERGLRLVPLVRTVYFGVRQVSESLTDRTAGFDSAVLVEPYRKGTYLIGFVTNESPTATREATGETLYTVFVPNSPNPTAGTLVLMPESELVEVDVSVREAIRLIVTTGLGTDEDVPAGTVMSDDHPGMPGGPASTDDATNAGQPQSAGGRGPDTGGNDD
jgi:uncharacterized membrane protein